MIVPDGPSVFGVDDVVHAFFAAALISGQRAAAVPTAPAPYIFSKSVVTPPPPPPV